MDTYTRVFWNAYGLIDEQYRRCVIEELISRSAVEVALPNRSDVLKVIGEFPSAFKKRVRIVDRKLQTMDRTLAIVQPFAKEYGLTLSENTWHYPHPNPPVEIIIAFTHLYNNLYHFLLGVDYNLQVDIDLLDLKKAFEILLNMSQGIDARAIASIFLGILSTYEFSTTTSLSAKSKATTELVDLFEQLLEDETYLQMSSSVHSLGIIKSGRHGLKMLGRLGKELINKPLFRGLIDVTAKGISTAAKLPLLDSKQFENFIGKNYLPPIISLDQVLMTAREKYIQVKTKNEFSPITKKSSGRKITRR